MPITLSQKTAIEEVIHSLLNVTTIRGKRPVRLAAMFMDLVDRKEWPAYYDVIPEPRCLKNIQAGVEKGQYKEASDVFTDLWLVFWNALFYNESDSQIALDAGFLKTLLEAEWIKRPVLPRLRRTSPPPSSAQKVHGVAAESKKNTIPTRTTPPAGQVLNASQDPEVDIITPNSNSPEDDGAATQTARDPQSEVIEQSEKGLPSLPGFREEGSMDEVKPGNSGRTQPQPPLAPPVATTGLVSSQAIALAVQSQNPYQQLQQPYMQALVQPQMQRPATLGSDRSIVTAAGGVVAIGGPTQVEKLPAETVKLFDRDPITNEVLWFAAPPMNVSRARGPRYSLGYLTFIATKRKRASGREEGTKDEWEGGSEAGKKRAREGFPPSVTETMKEVWTEMRADGYTI